MRIAIIDISNMASNTDSKISSSMSLWMILSALVLMWPNCVLSLNGDIRLADGSSPYEGRVEIYYSGQWGTVCDDNWDDLDAQVVCRQLGYSGGSSYPEYGSGSGTIWLDDVGCYGWESRLEYCSNRGWGVNNCGHSEDAGVSCTATGFEGSVRLVNGNSPYEGRVEIYHDGEWGTVCDDSWDDSDARVVCRQLGYSTDNAQARTDGYYGLGSGSIYLDEVGCLGYESLLTQCSNNGWGVHNCGHSEDAGVYCASGLGGSLRLVDGNSLYEGRVEIYHDGEWGTVCDDSWDDSDARVVCRQLGYSTDNAQARTGSYYGRGSGSIYLDEVGCLGYESFLTECSNDGWGVHDCSHSEDAGVYCASGFEGSVRLVDGYSLYEGRVEIFHDGEWGTVCDDGWDNSDARVVCRQLGYSTDNAQALTGGIYGEGSGPILLDDVVCFGNEYRLTECSNDGWGVHNCVHSEDAGVQCESPDYPTPVSPWHSRIVGIMSFVGVSLSLLTLFSIIAVWYTCSRPKPATNPTTSQQIPLGNATSHPAAHNTPASPATNGMTYPTQVTTQPATQPPPSAPQQTLNSNPYPPEAAARSETSPPEYMTVVDSQTDTLPPPN